MNPKIDGYRSLHYVLKFSDPNRPTHLQRHFMELQLRTRLQHLWATALETVGIAERINLKGGEGPKYWKDFFACLSSEFAILDSIPSIQDPDAGITILHLDRELKLLRKIQKYSGALRQVESAPLPTDSLAIVVQDELLQTVEIHVCADAVSATRAYERFESEPRRFNAVLVDVSDALSLRQTYPNYFFDLRGFVEAVRNVIRLAVVEETRRSSGIDIGFLGSDWKRKR